MDDSFGDSFDNSSGWTPHPDGSVSSSTNSYDLPLGNGAEGLYPRSSYNMASELSQTEMLVDKDMSLTVHDMEMIDSVMDAGNGLSHTQAGLRSDVPAQYTAPFHAPPTSDLDGRVHAPHLGLHMHGLPVLQFSGQAPIVYAHQHQHAPALMASLHAQHSSQFCPPGQMHGPPLFAYQHQHAPTPPPMIVLPYQSMPNYGYHVQNPEPSHPNPMPSPALAIGSMSNPTGSYQFESVMEDGRSTTSSKDIAGADSIKYYIQSGFLNWVEVLRLSQSFAYQRLVKNLLLDVSDTFAMDMIIAGMAVHRKGTETRASVHVESRKSLLIVTAPACDAMILSCIKRFVRRTLPRDKKKVLVCITSVDEPSLQMAGLSPQQMKERVITLLAPHGSLLHLQASDGSVQSAFGHKVIERCIRAIGYGRGYGHYTYESDMPAGMDHRAFFASRAEVLGYVSNLIVANVQDYSTGVHLPIKMTASIFAVRFARNYSDAKNAAESDGLLRMFDTIIQYESQISIKTDPLPVPLREVYKHRLDSTPEAHKYMLAVACSQCPHPIIRRASF